MDTIRDNIALGLFHVLDIRALDHLFFLLALSISFRFKHWKKALLTISFFTLAHTITLFVAAYNQLPINYDLIEILIPITILITAVINILYQNKKQLSYATAFFFGLIHGFGFSSGFRMLFGRVTNKSALLLEFAVGIELAQIILILVVLTVNYLVLDMLKINKNVWIKIVSSLIIIASVLLFF